MGLKWARQAGKRVVQVASWVDASESLGRMNKQVSVQVKVSRVGLGLG